MSLKMIKKILIVDEDETIKDSMKKFFTDQGYQVTTASDSQEAFKLFISENPEIVFTELKLNGHGSLKMCKQIKAQNYNCVIYAFSSYLKEFAPNLLESYGFDGHIQKPLREKTIKTAVEGAFYKLQNLQEGKS
jgi:DNA-binding response OmpR family regulator